VFAEPVFATEPFLASAPVAPSAGQAVSADRAIGVSYEITQDGPHGIHGQIVIANKSSAPVRGWRVTVVLPGDTGYQVLNAGNRSAGDALVMAAPAGARTLPGGSTQLIAFTARGTTSTPVRCTFTDSSRGHAGRSGSGAATGPGAGHAAGQPQGGHHGHDGWLGSWLNGGWPSGGSHSGGWPSGGWPGQGGPGGGWPGDGQSGQHHGWPGGR
jgi:hypothetical protein